MTRLFGLIFFWYLSTAFISRAQSITAADSVYGYGGVRLETPIDSLKTMAKEGFLLKKVQCRRTDEVLQLNNAQLQSVKYYFFDDRLHSIVLKAEIGLYAAIALRWLEARYGKGQPTPKQNPYEKHLIWQGDKLTIYFDENNKTRQVSITFESIAMQSLFAKTYNLGR